MTPRTYFIETFGCQMNKGDSEFMAASLEREGFLPAPSEDEAGVVIFNTCSVRSHAEDRALARIREAKAHAGRGRVVAVAGCMAQRIGEEMIAQGAADLAMGPYRSLDAGKIISEFLIDRGRALHLTQERSLLASRVDTECVTRDILPWHKWVTITHGCENFCAYCIVPYVRGPLVSFESGEIIRSIERAAGNGVIEITLLGQNVNQYGQDSGDVPFHELLSRAAAVPGIARVNFLTSHPKDFTPDIARVIAAHGNISRAIHLPLQSGSDRVLALMNRGYDMGHYLRVVDSIASVLPDYALSTDLIAGFPGETADDFQGTLSAMERIRFDEAFMYAYSPREGTAAFSLPESLTRAEKLERLRSIIDAQREISRSRLAAREGRTERVIVESISKKSADEVMGRTFLNHPMVLPGAKDDIGRVLDVVVRGLRGSTLYGERVA
ncbi:MAG: tRNA (N6-isopentenyl adenosine(37)-C2)-methylthiotransferase MiaB [Spirochaetes bacterium]|nr:MAG: tRNA (N6-isopentenyl adenosine(37)-C2)-methylthiotransferase MiaB [Spirochaetota bacterium]